MQSHEDEGWPVLAKEGALWLDRRNRWQSQVGRWTEREILQLNSGRPVK
jgi:hypothetical protein